MFVQTLRKILLLAVCVLALTVAAPAMAQTPTGDAYGGLAGVAQGGGSDNDSGGPTASADSGSLPFTGLELGVFAIAGVALLGTGLVLRRSVRSGGAQA